MRNRRASIRRVDALGPWVRARKVLRISSVFCSLQPFFAIEMASAAAAARSPGGFARAVQVKLDAIYQPLQAPRAPPNVTHVNCWSQEDPCYCIAAPNGRDLHCPGLRPSRPFRLHSVASSATQPPAIEDFPTLLTCMHGMVTNCMHGTVLTCLSHSAAKQSSAGGKRGSKGRHGIDTVFSGGAAAPSGLGSIRRLVAVGFPQCLLRHEHSNSREGR